MAEYFIGIDGGGTKSKLVLVNSNLEILSEQRGCETNLLSARIENAAKTFPGLIKKSITSANISFQEINGTAVGTAGAGRYSQYSEMLINKISKQFKNINLCSPQYSPEPGAVLLSIENYKKQIEHF